MPPPRRDSRTPTVLLALGALDAIYIVLRIVLTATIPLVGVFAAIILMIAMVVVRMRNRRAF